MRIRSISTAVVLGFVIAACGGITADNGGTEGSVEVPSDTPATSAQGATSTSIDAGRSSSSTTSMTSAVDGNAAAEEVADAEGAGEAADRQEARSESGDDDSVPGETVPTTEPDHAVSGEVPQAYLDAVMTDASSATGVPLGDPTVLRAEFVEWPDGSLGCPEPGVVYTQAVTPGYWVEIGVGDEVVDYRLNENGFFKLCAGTTTPHDSGSGAGSTQPGGDS